MQSPSVPATADSESDAGVIESVAEGISILSKSWEHELPTIKLLSECRQCSDSQSQDLQFKVSLCYQRVHEVERTRFFPRHAHLRSEFLHRD